VDLPKPPTHIGYKAFLGGVLELEVKTYKKLVQGKWISNIMEKSCRHWMC
jgi:hypothetical protein